MSTEEQKTTIEHQELFPISTFKLGEYPNNSYFDYFLMLEDDFFNTRRYVEICKGNFNSYSFEFDKIIKLACAAIEDLLKLICGIQPSAQTNIAVYRKYFSEHFADFHKIEVYCLLSTPRKIRPWLVWESERTPGWWGAYNSIKHSQSTNFKKATQHNALKTLAALYSLNLILYGKNLSIRPKLFTYPGVPKNLVTLAEVNIPGFNANQIIGKIPNQTTLCHFKPTAIKT